MVLDMLPTCMIDAAVAAMACSTTLLPAAALVKLYVRALYGRSAARNPPGL